jgi:hypothetical protein
MKPGMSISIEMLGMLGRFSDGSSGIVTDGRGKSNAGMSAARSIASDGMLGSEREGSEGIVKEGKPQLIR